ncbi:MAG: PAS domain S-box protein [Anaerolineae bacterium]|nr:PAS domain S-box protein [Anaerolineae bacterium]
MLTLRARLKAARWILWGNVAILGVGLILSIVGMFRRLRVQEEPHWIYLLLMPLLLVSALIALHGLQRSISRAMSFYAWTAMLFTGIMLGYDVLILHEISVAVFTFHMGIFSLGLVLGFRAALYYATATSFLLLGLGILSGHAGAMVLPIALAYGMAFPSWLVGALNKDLQVSAEQFRAIVQHSLDVILIVDRETAHILSASPSTQRVLGYMPESLIGIHFLSLFASHKNLSLAHLVESVYIQGAFFLSNSFFRADGTVCPTDLTATVIPWEDGEALLITLRDITERKQTEDELRKYRYHLEDLVAERTAELEARNRELDAFARTVAHDLQNPLGLIIGYAEVLKDTRIQATGECELQPVTVPAMSLADARFYVRRIAKAGRTMQNMIQELLLLARLPREGVTVIPLNMRDIVEEVLQRFVYMIEEAKAEMIVPDTWPVALGYAPWVEEVWANYLSNALKYGGNPPQIELGATLLLGDGNGNAPMVKFWVRDNGMGLSQDEQARLFETFVQLHKIRAKGHGLGLSIVRRIVERLDGKVGVESQPGQGSTFSFSLPAAMNDDVEQTSTSPSGIVRELVADI